MCDAVTHRTSVTLTAFFFCSCRETLGSACTSQAIRRRTTQFYHIQGSPVPVSNRNDVWASRKTLPDPWEAAGVDSLRTQKGFENKTWTQRKKTTASAKLAPNSDRGGQGGDRKPSLLCLLLPEVCANVSRIGPRQLDRGESEAVIHGDTLAVVVRGRQG